MLVVSFILTAVVKVGQSKGVEAVEDFDYTLDRINCYSNTNTTAISEQVLTAYRTCNANIYLHDGSCMLPCIANEMGLIVEGKLRQNSVSEYVSEQFENSDPRQRKQLTGDVKNCFHKYGLSGGKFPAEFQKCHKQAKDLFKLSNCILLAQNCLGRDAVFTSAVTARKRKKRSLVLSIQKGFYITMAIASGVGALIMSGVAIENSQKCGTSGCYKGYCYSYCGLSNTSGDWCYTTKSFSQSFKYVKCKSNSECNGCWKCAGSCTVG